MLGDPDGQWERWFETFGVQPPARYAAVFDDSESHHRAALDGVRVALVRVTRARLLLDSGQLVMLTAQRLQARYSHWLVSPPEAAAPPGLPASPPWLQHQAAEPGRPTEGELRPCGGASASRVFPRTPGPPRDTPTA